MLKKVLYRHSPIAAIMLGSVLLVSWGTWGHQHINRAAVFALPETMRPFFYNHIDFITEESVVPDIRKYTINDKPELPRHYIDLETYDTGNPDSLPRNMKELTAKYDAAFRDKAGILPWYIPEITEKLTMAFHDRKKTEIIFLAADLGHYIGDAHMPLHTSLNHDGQLTGQRGIHAFWESQLPEQFGSSYNFYTGDAVYISDIPGETWRIVLASHRLADSVLLIEKRLKENFPADKIYKKDSAGNVVKNKYHQWVHSYEYAKAYHEALHGMVEQQLRLAIAATANFWYTAWVNAGKPDLGGLDPAELTKRNSKNCRRDYHKWRKGELFGLKIDKEF
jgi:hypothetical protein